MELCGDAARISRNSDLFSRHYDSNFLKKTSVHRVKKRCTPHKNEVHADFLKFINPLKK